MTLPAIPTSISAKSSLASAGMALALALPTPALAQDVNMPGDEPDVGDVARTPLDILNIDPKDIPEVLLEAVEDPYATDGLTSCNSIVAEVARIDTILGADFDLAEEEEGGGISEGRVAQSIVGSFIPFRGIVREVSGANKRRREVNRAITAGMVRRGFLKGLGLQRGCNYPARPREERG